DSVSITRKQGLEFRNGCPGVPWPEDRGATDAPWRDKMPDVILGKKPPGKPFAGVYLAARRDIRVRQDTLGRNRVARNHAAAELDDRRNLPLRKVPVSKLVARIDDLDPDRTGIDVRFAAP